MFVIKIGPSQTFFCSYSDDVITYVDGKLWCCSHVEKQQIWRYVRFLLYNVSYSLSGQDDYKPVHAVQLPVRHLK